MKISKKDIKLLIALSGILVLVCVYFLLYQPLAEKTTALESENSSLKQRVSELQALADQKDFFEEETARMKDENEEILNRFPADVRSEDAIMLAVEVGYASPAEIISVSMETPVDLYHISAPQTAQTVTDTTVTDAAAQQAADTTVQPAAADTAAQQAGQTAVQTAAEQVLYSRKVQINYKCNYDEFKNSIRYLYDSTDRRIVGSVNASYDMSTGLLDVSLNSGLYYMTGTQREYVEPNIPYIPQGTDNIFGTLTIPTQAAQQPAEQE